MTAVPVPAHSRTIAIIGGGLSGTLIAVHLLKVAPAGTHVVLVERHPPAGRGVAYGTEFPGHLLNVPANRMSAFADQPNHFFDWVVERVGRVGYPAQVVPGDFLPRTLYGDYISSVLTQARQQASETVKFTSVTGETIDIEERAEGRARLLLEDGRTIDADRAVLAIGNLSGEYPIRRALPFYHGRRYVHIPWQPGVLDGIGTKDDVLIVGAGLTATDIIVQLDRLGHQGTVHALSRRGLRPQVHQAGVGPHPTFLGTPLPTTIREVVRRVRAEVKKTTGAGDWRGVLDSLRAQSHALWQGFSWDERARFMRHVRPFWDVHRHRLAPEIAAIVDGLVQSGRVRFYAGRLQNLREMPTGAEVAFRKRGTEDIVTLNVAKVINCTGPRTDYSKYQHPLLINLLARGLIDHDPLALGLHALPTGDVLRYRGGPTGWLFTIGAPLKGVLWESTAAPEIRVQARELAERLLSS